MRFHVKTRPEHVSWEWMRDTWVAADGIPLFESAWHWDHFYPLTGDLNGPNLEGWTTLAALAQATTRIRVGCQVTGMIYRHPAVLANMASAVDLISAGRLELGIGAGWNELETTAYGIELPPLKRRFDQFDEGVQVLIGLLTDEYTTFDGRYFTLTRARNEPKGPQKPHPPITIGGKGPKRTLLAVAKWAQAWNAIVSGPAEWGGLKSVLVEHCQAVGRDPAEIDCSVNVLVAGQDDAAVGKAVELAASYRDAGADIAVINLPHNAPATLLDRLASSLSEL
ncbi:MAG: TIGR03560 family F420-dependent LLM class oxidoreductase [Dermatophilaceae bacterium]